MDHSAGRELPDAFTPVLAESDLPEGASKRARYKETPLLLVKRGDRLYAFVEACAHLGGPLAEGRLEGDTVVCPWHSSRFALATGVGRRWTVCLSAAMSRGADPRRPDRSAEQRVLSEERLGAGIGRHAGGRRSVLRTPPITDAATNRGTITRRLFLRGVVMTVPLLPAAGGGRCALANSRIR